jgi:hypothetical protein
MVDLQGLRDSYCLRNLDPSFASGRRAKLVYAVQSLAISFSALNPEGIDPLTYLEYAQQDIRSGAERGAVNALGNAKRAVHFIIDKLLDIYRLDDWARKPFPDRVALLGELEAFPPGMIAALNSERNVMEHEYRSVDRQRAGDLVELVEMFITVAYPFFRSGVLGAFVGIEGSKACQEWFLDRKEARIIVRDVSAAHHLDFEGERVYLNIKRPEVVEPQMTIPMTKQRKQDWLPYLDLFIYLTRKQALRLPADPRGPGPYYYEMGVHFMDVEADVSE